MPIISNFPSGTGSFKPTASTTATSGVSYTNGISGLDAATVSLFGEAISRNKSIGNRSSVAYLDFGSIHRKISIGDQVILPLNGTDYTFDIIGFNHDILTNAADYGVPTATGKAGITLQMHDLFATEYAINGLNITGWKNSDMRISTMATMRGYLPFAWQGIIKAVNKVSAIGAGSSETEVVSDYCFLLAEAEIFGSKSKDSLPAERSGVRQYTYYIAGNSPVKNRGGSADTWWERSVCSYDDNFNCYVNPDGSQYAGDCDTSMGVAFGFCV